VDLFWNLAFHGAEKSSGLSLWPQFGHEWKINWFISFEDSEWSHSAHLNNWAFMIYLRSPLVIKQMLTGQNLMPYWPHRGWTWNWWAEGCAGLRIVLLPTRVRRSWIFTMALPSAWIFCCLTVSASP
jgi:hypothetical protein